MSWPRWLVAGLLLWRPGFSPRPCDIVVDKVASPKAAVYPISIVPSVLHTHSLIYHRCFIMLALTMQLHDTKHGDVFSEEL
jgi:hypothetical protein